MTAMLPPAARTRWREDWLGEPNTLPAGRSWERFAAHTLLGVPAAGRDLAQAVPW